MAASFYSVRGVERNPVWFAGYVLGLIKRSATGGDYPAPPFTEDELPDDAPPELVTALHHWRVDSRLTACVQDGVVKTPLPPLEWLEINTEVCFSCPSMPL